MSVGGVYPQASWLGELGAVTSKELLCRDQPFGAELASAGVWCLLSLPLECVACGGCLLVVLQCGLKLSTGCTGCEASRDMQAKVNYCLCSVQGHMAWATKPSSDGCYLCWAWRCLVEANLQTRAGCHWCQAWDHLARGTGRAEARCCLFEKF